MWNKIKYYVMAFFSGIGAVLFFWLKFKSEDIEEKPDPYEGLVKHHEEEVKTVDEKLEKLKEVGVEDKDDSGIVEYWKNQ